MIIQTITAVYKNGVLQPKKPLNLTENEQVEIQILQKPASEKPVLKLSGALAGLGDITYEEIQAITREMHEQHMKKLLDPFDEPTNDSDD